MIIIHTTADAAYDHCIVFFRNNLNRSHDLNRLLLYPTLDYLSRKRRSRFIPMRPTPQVLQ
jgi:hypothetical protein